MSAEMKWYIKNNALNLLLYWDDYLLYFDTFEQAKRFLLSCAHKLESDYPDVSIVERIVFCDDPVFNASHCVVELEENTSEDYIVYLGEEESDVPIRITLPPRQ